MLLKLAPVAQLDRAFDCGSKGQRFESPRARHLQRKMMNLNEILEKTKNVRLVAASKYVGASEIAQLAVCASLAKIKCKPLRRKKKH